MSSMWGKALKISLFGESHGEGIGVVIDGLPSGFEVDLAQLRAFMKRRAPGQTPWSTARAESDLPKILSGLYKGETTGTPLTAVILNHDTLSRDYQNLQDVPRPSHADYTGRLRYKGANDPRGGGHFSGRLTAPLCFAGGLARQILEAQGVYLAAHIKSLAGIEDRAIDLAGPPVEALAQIQDKTFPVLDDDQGQKMIDLVLEAKKDLDSVGGIVELVAWGFPAGIGNPIFGSLEGELSSMLFSVPAVKAVSFGRGFDMTTARGSENNDAPYYDGDQVRFKTNNGGGIDGGISNGMPIVFQVGIKPTASISQAQASVNLAKGEDTDLVIKGRHDPCIVPRAVPVVEAATSLVLLDQLIQARGLQGMGEK
jgi:chorismate synthase